MISFPTDWQYIESRVKAIQPKNYGYSRNYVDGAVTYLSPYISRGVISTLTVWEEIKSRGLPWNDVEKLVQELAWRDYFQRLAIEKNVDEDIKNEQSGARYQGIPISIINATTGINAIDNAIKKLYQTGYMHNHHRMYVASLVCNLGQSHWKNGAQWMYYHLLDGDWASNACSWQWVAGSNSSKKYYANQDNINKFDRSHQTGTFLDIPTDELHGQPLPEALSINQTWHPKHKLPNFKKVSLDPKLPLCIYTAYNLDARWKSNLTANRVLLLEPCHYEKYAVGEAVIQFIIGLSQNILGIQIFTGSFSELMLHYKGAEIYYKEHPFAGHYNGIREERDWLTPELSGYYPSFFSYWKKMEKILKERYHS